MRRVVGAGRWLVLVLLIGCTGTFPVPDAAVARADAEADVERLGEALAAIEAWHAHHRTGAVPQLAPGTSEERIEAALATLGLRPPAELVRLWSWHDGGGGEVPLVWGQDFLSLEEAVAEYRGLVRNPLIRWDPTYVPILSFQGEWFAVRCAPEAHRGGPVVHSFIESEAAHVATNLTTFFVTLAEGFAEEVVTWDPELEAATEDLAALAAIHGRHNPGCSFPYAVPP